MRHTRIFDIQETAVVLDGSEFEGEIEKEFMLLKLQIKKTTCGA